MNCLTKKKEQSENLRLIVEFGVTSEMGIDDGVTCPFRGCYFMKVMNIIGSDITRNGPRLLVMDHVFLLLLTPPGSLAVEHSNNSREFV